ncbi:AraC family transcriptional regulator [Paenibacillus dendritiformis]|uniref:helix-turn-helix domain-containing protein n=1 Tax=Paenibacillus dendritiformis TaxID=130049 RepID=UPI00143D93A4|nr:AraC family transcriptional regulator [Paenibacillus dendritiformis]NKI24775.1 AraC family transcriptional regulator [Paenibacillus dendritiformis]NRG00498.1 AraC family transcriptional regulator [Paenibacillus dendritiformis]
MGKPELLQRYLANVRLSVTDAYYTKCNPGWRESDFVPEFNRMYLIRSGEGRIVIDGTAYNPGPGQMVIMPARVLQSYGTISARTYEKYWCHFTALMGQRHLFQSMRIPYCLTLPEDVFREAESHFERLIRCHAGGDWTAELNKQAMLIELLSLYFRTAGLERIDLPSSQTLDKLNLALQMMHEHLSERLNVQQLAERVHFHPNYFITLFREHMGESPVQYMNRMKIERAKQLLLTTALTVTEVADAVGLDVYYFSRLFKNSTGFNPTSFKAAHKTEAK